MGDKRWILGGVTLSTLRDWLNLNKEKQNTGKRSDFTINDVKAYCSRGRLPKYLGGNRIERVVSKKDARIKVYNLLANEE